MGLLKIQSIDRSVTLKLEEITAQETRNRDGRNLRGVKLFLLTGRETDFKLEILLPGACLDIQPEKN